jgi:hypothetical protein
MPSPYDPGDPSGDALAASIHDVAVLAADARERGLPVWFVDWPTNMTGALTHYHSWVPGWREALTPLGVRFVGHALSHRSCWGDVDFNHPGTQGARALSEIIAKVMIDGGSLDEVATLPPCATY